MHIKAIICEALYREFCWTASRSRHLVDLVVLDFGLHDTPEKLRSAIQSEIDNVDPEEYEAVVLGYGLCSRGTAEIVAGSVPLVMIKAHDCITMLLGARSSYLEEFAQNPGTYYYSSGWIERKDGEVEQGSLSDVWERQYEHKLAQYTEKYGADNAAFLLEQEKMWVSNYNRAAFLDTGLGDVDQYRQFVSTIAGQRGWSYSEISADLGLVERLLSGDWAGDPDLLVVEPGRRIVESYDAEIIRCSG